MIIFIIAGVLTPPDVLSQFMLAIPILLLYEISILLIRRIEKQREARMRADGTWIDEDEDETEPATKA